MNPLPVHTFFLCANNESSVNAYIRKWLLSINVRNLQSVFLMILVRYEGEANFSLWMVLIFQFQLKGITINIYCYSLIIDCYGKENMLS